MYGNRDYRAPIQVWKLALLFAATASLYQFAWLYGTARTLKEHRDPSITPWHWAIAPLLGPFMAVPAYYLARNLKRWQIEEGKAIGHFAEPMFVAVLVVSSFLPLIFIFAEAVIDLSYLVVFIAVICAPWLALQGQLNINLDAAERGRYQRGFPISQVAFATVGLVLAVPLYIQSFSETRQADGAARLAAGDVVDAAAGFYRVRIGDEHWTRIENGVLSEDSGLEFLGPDNNTWAIVYDSSGLTVNDLIAYRIKGAREDYRNTECTQEKRVLPDELIVVGIVECWGRNAIDGNFILIGRSLRYDNKLVEIVVYSSHPDRVAYREVVNDVRRMADGLELVL